MQLSGVGKFLGKMHEFENEHSVFGLHTREILARFDDDFGDADFFARLQRVTQQHIGFVAAFLRFQIVRLIEKHRVDFINVDKILDVHRLRRFQIDALKIFVFQDDELPFLILITLHDLVPRDFFAVGFRDPFVIDGT